MPKTTKTKEKDMPNENKQCCEKCLGTHFREAGTNSWQEVTTPSCMDSNCPCHQEEKEWEARERIGEKPFDTPSQEENHSIHCECLKCFTEEPPKPKWEEVDKKFTDQFWASTQGRNDIRNEQIKKLLATKIDIDEVVGMLEGMKHPNLSAMESGSEFMTPRMYRALGYNNALSSLKQKLLDLRK